MGNIIKTQTPDYMAQEITATHRDQIPVAGNTAEQVISGLFSRLPSGPISARSGKQASKVLREPWSVEPRGDRIVVYLPKNLEALADSPLHQAAVAACYVLKPVYEFSDYDSEAHELLDKKAISYLQGLSWALHDGEGSLAVYRDVSGAMGHAYYWVGHQALLQEFKSTTYFRGSSWHPTKGVTGKAWSSDLDKSTRSIFALVSRAAKVLKVEKNWKSWFRTKESFLGKEIKKSLPHEGTDILTVAEKEYLSIHYNEAVRKYKDFLMQLSFPSEEMISSLPDKFKEVGRSLQPLCEAVDKTISHRLSSAYPDNRRERMKARKKPIKEVLSELDTTTYIYVMDPLVLAGMKAFRIDNPDDLPTDELPWTEYHTIYKRRIDSVERTNPELAGVARSFQTANFFVSRGGAKA